MSAFNDIACMKHVKASGRLLSESSISDPEQRRLQLKHAWRLACVFFFSNWKLWQANFTTDHLQTVCMVAEVASRKAMYKLHSRDSAHDLLSPCMCSDNICPDWQQTVTNPVGIRGLCAMIITTTRCCLLRLAPWCWKHLPSTPPSYTFYKIGKWSTSIVAIENHCCPNEFGCSYVCTPFVCEDHRMIAEHAHKWFMLWQWKEMRNCVCK